MAAALAGELLLGFAEPAAARRSADADGGLGVGGTGSRIHRFLLVRSMQ